VPSWWDWQETTTPLWGALGAKVGRQKIPDLTPETENPLLKIGAKGDLVVWAQERLITAGEEVEVNGIFERKTRRAVRAFQEAHGLEVDGQLDSETWAQLINYTPFDVDWSATTPIVSSLGAKTAAHRPASASVPPVRDELAPN
jgi:peptidoglycan hydrolase-like protein with peptidoglycan-binding domain